MLVNNPRKITQLFTTTDGSVTLTGTTIETAMLSYYLPSNFFPKSFGLLTSCLWSWTSNANTKRLLLRINGDQVCVLPRTTGLYNHFDRMIVQQNYGLFVTTNPQNPNGYTNTTTVNISAMSGDVRDNIILSVTGLLDNASDSITIEYFSVLCLFPQNI